MKIRQVVLRMKRRWYAAQTAVLFTADQIMKSYAEQDLDKNEERKLPGPLRLRRIENKGMCMGALADHPASVRLISAAASVTVTLFQIVCIIKKKGFWKKTGLGLLSAGAWSNTFDRFVRGYVVDYVGLDVKNPRIARITYNLGDFFIAAGAMILSVCSVFSPCKKREENDQEG